MDAAAHLEESIRNLTESDEEYSEVIQELGVLEDPYRSIADRRFRPIRGTYLDGRYNKKSFPGFYVAEDHQTSMAEVLHGKLKSIAAIKTPVFLEFTRWEIGGSGRDIAEEVSNYPDLVHSGDWTFCQEVGQAAIDQAEDLLRVASARNSGGINVVSFARHQIRSLGGRAGTARIDEDPTAGLSIRQL